MVECNTYVVEAYMVEAYFYGHICGGGIFLWIHMWWRHIFMGTYVVEAYFYGYICGGGIFRIRFSANSV